VNDYMDAQIKNMIAMTKTFNQSCKMAAMKNDGQINKEEQKILKKIESATQHFIKELEKIN